MHEHLRINLFEFALFLALIGPLGLVPVRRGDGEAALGPGPPVPGEGTEGRFVLRAPCQGLAAPQQDAVGLLSVARGSKYKFLVNPDCIRLVGEDGNNHWVSLHYQDLKGHSPQPWSFPGN